MKKYVALLIFFSLITYTYQWPVSPFSGPHPINAVLGEFREPYGTSLDYHFHSGVDIGRGAGTNVHPSFSGDIPEKHGMSSKNIENGWVQVGKGRYVHINVDDNLEPGQHCEVSVALLAEVSYFYFLK